METRFASVLVEDDAIRQRVVGGSALQRHAQPHEMAGTAVYLLSEASSYVSVHTIVADGGTTIT